MLDNSYAARKYFFCLVLLVTFFFGLNPKDFSGKHKPTINESGELIFKKYSVATVETNWGNVSGNNIRLGEQILKATLEISNIPIYSNRFSVILSINNSNSQNELLLGQWASYLVIMSGDDYANRKKKPRLTIPLDSVPDYSHPQAVRIEIETTSGYTAVSINGHEIARSTDFTTPNMQGKNTISLGNTLDRTHGWSGNLRALSLAYSNCSNIEPSNPQSKSNLHCSQNQQFNFQKNGDSNESSTTPIENNKAVNEASEVILQSPYKILGSEWFTVDSIYQYKTPGFVKDALINFLGFIPITIALFTLIIVKFNLLKSSLITISVIFLISFIIEATQAFIPSRTSSIVDLSINSLSGISTVLITCTVMRIWQKLRQSD